MNYDDSIQETTAGTSTSVVVVNGATSGGRPFASGLTVGMAKIPLRVADDAGNWLTGEFTLTNATTLTRTRISASSNAGGEVTLAGSVRKVSCVPLASMFAAGITNPDDVGYDIILLIGQSNMLGAGAIDAKIDVADSRVFQFGGVSGDSTYYRRIYQALDPLSHPGGAGCGPGMALARTYAASTPTNRRVLLVPCAVGGTRLVAGSPPEWGVSNSLYENAIAQGLAAVTEAQQFYPNSRIAGFAWVQGESDGDATTPQATYVTALKAMIAGMRLRLSVPKAWFVIGGMLPEGISSRPANTYLAIKNAQIQVAAEINYCGFVTGPVGYDSGDQLHYNARGSRRLGAAMGLGISAAAVHIGTDVPPAASAVVLAVANASGVGTAPVQVTVTTNYPLTVGQSKVVTLTSDIAGSFSPASVTLTPGSNIATSDFTPTSATPTSGTLTGAAPALANGTVGYAILSSATVPTAPTIGVLVAGDGYVDVPFTHNSNGGAAVIDSTATLSTGQTATLSTGITGPGGTNTIRVSAPNGTAVTATVKDRNSVGSSAASAASNSLPPAAPGTAHTIGFYSGGTGPVASVAASTLYLNNGTTRVYQTAQYYSILPDTASAKSGWGTSATVAPSAITSAQNDGTTAMNGMVPMSALGNPDYFADESKLYVPVGSGTTVWYFWIKPVDGPAVCVNPTSGTTVTGA